MNLKMMSCAVILAFVLSRIAVTCIQQILTRKHRISRRSIRAGRLGKDDCSTSA